MNEKEIAANHERFDKCFLVVAKSHTASKLFKCCYESGDFAMFVVKRLFTNVIFC